jgi:hypothetical protein
MQPDPRSFLNCCQIASLATLAPQYIVIATQTFFFYARPLKQFKVITLFNAIVQRPVLSWHLQLAVFECRHYLIHRAIQAAGQVQAQSRPGFSQAFLLKDLLTSPVHIGGQGLKSPRLSSISPHQIVAMVCTLRLPFERFIVV